MSFLFHKKNILNKGFNLLEIVVGVTIISIFLLAVAPLFQSFLKIGYGNTKIIQASFLLEEGVEAVKILRDDSWQNNISTLNTGTDYFLYFNGDSWQTTTSYSQIDGIFERKFIISDVYRDENDDISLSGTLDSNIKKIDMSISWLKDKGTTTKTVATYVTNLFDN